MTARELLIRKLNQAPEELVQVMLEYLRQQLHPFNPLPVRLIRL